MDNVIREVEECFYDFDVVQLVNVIEEVLGAGSNSADGGGICFESEPSFVFPPSDIARVEIIPCDNRATVRMPVMNLLGITTPLPITLSDHINRDRFGAEEYQDFLTIMQNRLHALWLEAQRVDIFDFTEFDVFSHGNRTASALQQLLESTWEDIPIRITENVGRWTQIDNMLELGLGLRLGSTILGTQVFDCTSKFRITLGPLDYNIYNSFLPENDNHNHIKSILTSYLNEPLICELDVLCKDEELIPAKLGGNIGGIGRTAVLGKTIGVCEYRYIVIIL